MTIALVNQTDGAPDAEPTNTEAALSAKDEVYLDLSDVCARLNCGRTSVYKWAKTKGMPKPLKIGGTTSRWRLSELIAWENQLAAAR